MKSFCLRSLFFSLLLLLYFSSFSQITPQQIQESTRHWLVDKIQSRANSSYSHLPLKTKTDQPAKGQYPNANISDSADPESEIHAAINPLDSNNIIVSSMRFASGFLGAELTIPIYYTNDFGESWQLSSFSPTTEGISIFEVVAGGGDPVLAFTPNGTAHFTWLLLTSSILGESSFVILHATSTDNGATWTTDQEPVDRGTVEIDASNFPEILISGRAVDKEWLAVDHSPSSPYFENLYASYVELTVDEIAHYQIMLSTWQEEQGFGTPIVAVDSLDFFLSQFITPAVSTNGDLHLSWLGVSYDDFYLGLYHTKSTDGGQSFSPPQLISYVNIPCFPPMTSTTPCIPGVDQDRTLSYNYILAGNTEATADHLYVTWSANGFEEAISPGFDIYFSRSTDGGDTWTSPEVLNQDEQAETHNFMPFPNLSPNGTLSVSWYDQRDDVNGESTNYYGIYSDDGGLTFSEDFIISCLPTNFSTVGLLNDNFGIGEYNATVSTEYQMIPFWSDGRFDNGNLDIFFAKIPFEEGLPTSIQTLQAAVNIKLDISPNPVSQVINLSINSQEKLTDVQITLLNAQGSIVKNVAINHPTIDANNSLLDLNVSELASGNYYLLLSSSQGRIGKKILVTH